MGSGTAGGPPRWEYRLECVEEPVALRLAERRQAVQRALDALGAAGWELVAVTPQSTSGYPGSLHAYALFLKRPLPPR